MVVSLAEPLSVFVRLHHEYVELFLIRGPVVHAVADLRVDTTRGRICECVVDLFGRERCIERRHLFHELRLTRP